MLEIFKDIITYDKPTYKLLKIKPDSRLTGNSYESIINAIHSVYKPINERITHKSNGLNGSIQIDMIKPIYYEILFDGDNKKATPIFYFAISTDYADYIKQRIQAIIPNSTITFEDDEMVKSIDMMFSNSNCYEYYYLKDSMLSIKTKENNFLESVLNVKNEILKGEGLLFQVEMTPISDFFKSFMDDKWDKVRSGKDVTIKRGVMTRVCDAVGHTADDILNIMDDIMEYKYSKNTKNKCDVVNISNFSTSSRQKKTYDGFRVSIKLFVSGCSKFKADSYANTFDVCMRELEEDNRLVVRKIKKPQSITRGRLSIPNGDIMSSKEVASIVNIPNNKLQRTFKIDSVNVKQVSAPTECKKGNVRIGMMEIHGETMPIYFPENRDVLAMPKFYICGMGGGKSNALLNYADDVVASGGSLVDINFVDKCQLAYAIKERRTNHMIFNMAELNNLPSLMLPEIEVLETDDVLTKKRKAGDCATEIEYFINSITSKGTEEMSTRMAQYLFCASKIVFIHNTRKTPMKIKTAFEIVDDKKIRHLWIEKAIESGIYNENDYDIRKLLELDDEKNMKKVDGILDRYSVLMRNSTFEAMLDSDNPQFNFIDIMDGGKSISICMPEDQFKNKATKDIIITYLMCRLRLAMLCRQDKDKVVHVLIDEAHHLNKSLDVISDSIAEPRKYGVAFVFATHYFDQMGDRLKKAILSVGGHFILLKGVGETAYNELKAKIGDEYDYEDIKAMEDWNSFDMIWIRGQHYMFVTKMLPVLKDKYGKKYI